MNIDVKPTIPCSMDESTQREIKLLEPCRSILQDTCCWCFPELVLSDDDLARILREDVVDKVLKGYASLQHKEFALLEKCHALILQIHNTSTIKGA